MAGAIDQRSKCFTIALLRLPLLLPASLLLLLGLSGFSLPSQSKEMRVSSTRSPRGHASWMEGERTTTEYDTCNMIHMISVARVTYSVPYRQGEVSGE